MVNDEDLILIDFAKLTSALYSGNLSEFEKSEMIKALQRKIDTYDIQENRRFCFNVSIKSLANIFLEE